MRTFFAAVAVVLCVAASASAAISNVRTTQTVVAGAPAGFVVNDLLINSTSNLEGQQLVLSLTAGSIYQDAVGGNTAPNPAFLPVFPSLAADTFVTVGGFTSATSQNVLVVGGAVNIPQGNPTLKFDGSGINITYAPATGVFTGAVSNYPIARITLSSDAQGTLYYFGASAGAPNVTTSIPVINGAIIPEPAAGLLAALAACGFGARRRG